MKFYTILNLISYNNWFTICYFFSLYFESYFWGQNVAYITKALSLIDLSALNNSYLNFQGIAVCGGFEGGNVKKTCFYHIIGSQDAPIPMPDMPMELSVSSTYETGNYFYAFSGRDSTGYGKHFYTVNGFLNIRTVKSQFYVKSYLNSPLTNFLFSKCFNFRFRTERKNLEFTWKFLKFYLLKILKISEYFVTVKKFWNLQTKFCNFCRGIVKCKNFQFYDIPGETSNRYF